MFFHRCSVLHLDHSTLGTDFCIIPLSLPLSQQGAQSKEGSVVQDCEELQDEVRLGVEPQGRKYLGANRVHPYSAPQAPDFFPLLFYYH